jgi:hypothetical protein
MLDRKLSPKLAISQQAIVTHSDSAASTGDGLEESVRIHDGN